MTARVITEYEKLTKLAGKDLKGEEVSVALVRTVKLALDYLSGNSHREELISEVAGKSYFTFKAAKGKKISRPVNSGLFDESIARAHAEKVLRADVQGLAKDKLSKTLYTSALAYCCAADLLKSEDRKTPGTFFEIFVGHLFARTYDVNPQRNIKVLSLAKDNSLPTDYVFDLGETKSRIHLPVKTSTRERVIQVWAHQRVLDGVYGANRFRGVLVCINETNKKSKANSVVEVCLPGQWAIYQMFIAQLHRVYYLDVPAKYATLGREYPFIQVKPLASFFLEASTLTSAPPV